MHFHILNSVTVIYLVSEMTYNVLMGTLNTSHSLTVALYHLLVFSFLQMPRTVIVSIGRNRWRWQSRKLILKQNKRRLFRDQKQACCKITDRRNQVRMWQSF